MDVNEKFVSEEVMETTEEMVTSGSGKGLKIAAGVGLVVLAGVLAYRYVAKPMIAKMKAKKGIEVIHSEVVDSETDKSEEGPEEL